MDNVKYAILLFYRCFYTGERYFHTGQKKTQQVESFKKKNRKKILRNFEEWRKIIFYNSQMTRLFFFLLYLPSISVE
jgi:hypothetical protein